MNWIVVKHLPLDLDLSHLAQFLNSRGLVYRFSEHQGQQVVSVQDPQMVEPLGQLIDEYLQGNVTLPQEESVQPLQGPVGISVWATPITLALIILSAAGALLIQMEYEQIWAMLTFQVFDPRYGFLPLSETFASGQIWRLLAPAFLHFGFFHFLFNSLWMWDFGRRLEIVLGKAHYLCFFLVTAISANFAQYLWIDSIPFGGMSGVVYALVGFIWVRQKLSPHPLFAIPRGIIAFMLMWLVICMAGVVDYFIDGSIANAAHVGGLVAGMVWGGVSGFYAARKK